MKQKITKKGYKKENRGITLVALVVTIVVLLILAGITITVLFGDNGIIKKVRDASRETKFAEIEEIANLGTMDLQIETIVNNEENISNANLLTRAMRALGTAGYATQSRENSGETLEGLTIAGLTSENINLVQGEEATIQVRLNMQGGSQKYYVELDGKFYEMKVLDGKVSVSREESTNIDGERYTIKLTNVSEGISLKVLGEELTAGSIIADETTIEVIAGETTGNYAFTIAIEDTVHSEEKTVVVTQNPKWATSISITSIAPGEIGEELRELEPGATLQLYANILPDTSTDTASWSITKGQDKATISEAGLLAINESAEAESEIEVTAKCMRNETTEANITPATYSVTVVSAGYKVGDAVDETTSHVGYYADFDPTDDKIDGVIYADLSKGGSGQWANSDGNYSYNKVEDVSSLKDYYISKKAYEGKFGTKDVITPIEGNSGTERFYIMALKDFTYTLEGGTKQTTFCWYDAACDEGGMTDYYSYTATQFRTGKKNTEDMITKWNASGYGTQDDNGTYLDMWGVIQAEKSKGWFIPSKDEWSAFAKEVCIPLGLTTSNYANFGLSRFYWSSSQTNPSGVWYPNFDAGFMTYCDVYNDNCVRLSATF